MESLESISVDPLTHTLAGATLAETRLGRGVRLGPAALIAGANVADVDAVSILAGSDFMLGFRRGWTHGVLAMAVLPLLLTAALLAFDAISRRRRARAGLPPPPPAAPRSLLFLSFVGVLSHPLLDWLNTYGIRLLMPFDDRWYYGDALFIIDPWLWLLLGGSLLLSRAGGPWWIVVAAFASTVVVGSGLAGSTAKLVWVAGLSMLIVARWSAGRRLRGARTAVAGLVVASVYIAVMVGSTGVAAGWVRNELERRGIVDVGRLMVGPLPADPFRRDVLAEVPGGYRFGRLDLLRPGTLEMHSRLLEIPDSPVMDVTYRAYEVRGAVDWMRFPFAEIQEGPDGYTVYLLDARYVRRRTDGFGSAVLLLDREDSPGATGNVTP